MREGIIDNDLKHVLEQTKLLWTDVKSQTFFITGGTGFFGKWLLESFLYINERLNLHNSLVVLTRSPEDFLARHPKYNHQPSVSFIKGDIRSFEFPQGDINYIIHAATEASATLNLEQPLYMYDTIVEGTKRVLELARKKKVKAVLHTSSGAVYGKQPSEVTHVSEDFAGSPNIYGADAAYGEGKRVAEMLSNFYFKQYSVPSKIARCFAFVGPYLPLDGHFAIGNFINDALKANTITVKGNGTPYRSYLYASDLTVWLWTILFTGKTCYPYNVGSDEDLTIEEVANMVASISSEPIAVAVLEKVKIKDPARYVPSISRAKNELDLKVMVPLNEAVQRTMKFTKIKETS